MVDEIGVSLDDLLDLSLLGELWAISSQMNDNLGTSFKSNILNFRNLKSSTSIRNPKISLLRVFSLGDNLNSVSDNEGGIETDSELSNNSITDGAVLALGFLNEFLGTTSGNSTKILNQTLSAHTTT